MHICEKLTGICDREVQVLLDSKVIKEIPFSDQHFVSGIFVIPTRSDGFRPIVN